MATSCHSLNIGVHACSCARAIEFVYVRVCQEPLHAGPGLAAFFDLHTAVDDQLQRNLC